MTEVTDEVGSTVLFENPRVRAWEMVLRPGETCLAHRHRHDAVFIYPEEATMRTENGVVQQVDPHAVAYRSVGEQGLPAHTIANVGQAVSRHYIVELLGPSVSSTPQPLEHNGRGRPVPP